VWAEETALKRCEETFIEYCRNYLLNTQLVQDIIKTYIHTELRKKTQNTLEKAYTHKTL